jgi:hypothetical protein
MSFNPFIKEIGEALTPADLDALINRKVAEGLYVEYKRTFPTNEKIANTIASFANSYGGWYIVGVEADKLNNAATKIVGFPLSDYPDPIAKVREIAKERVDPFPAISPQVVTLNAGTAVLVVHIPGNQDKPFISSNGRIYRRVADSSDPVFEKDRYTIDRLYEEGQQSSKEFESFLEDDEEIDNRNAAWLKVFLTPHPEEITAVEVFFTEDIERLIERSNQERTIPLFGIHEITGNAPFSSFQITHQSVILSQRPPVRLDGASTELELFTDGRGKLSIPLTLSAYPAEPELKSLSSSTTRSVIQALSSRESDEFLFLRFLNVAEMMAGIGALLSFYLEWVKEHGPVSEFRVAIKLEGVRNVVPFFDAEEWGQYVKNYGLPVMRRERVQIPGGVRKSRLWDASPSTKSPLLEMVCYMAGHALGLPHDLQSSAFFKTYGSS